MTRKQQREALARLDTEAADAANAGRDYFKDNPEILLAAAMWEADRRYGQNSLHELFGFYTGFRQARQQRDEYLSERSAKPAGWYLKGKPSVPDWGSP